MRFNLATLARQAGTRRKTIAMRPIKAPASFASELFHITREVPDAWKASLPRITAAYERALSALVTDSAEDAGDEIGSIFAEVDALILRLTPRLRDWALRVERWHRGRWAGNVLSATSVDLSTVLSAFDVSQTVAASIEWNVALVRDVSAQIRQRIANEVFAGLQSRTPARDVGRAIDEATGLGRDRSKRIASDQATKLTSRLDEARQQQAGLDEYRWQHSHKAHPREEHLKRDGNVYKWDDPEIGTDKPGVAPFCGCVAVPVLSMDD